MNPAISLLNPDIDIHGSEEEEAAKDAEIKQEELKASLKNAFDDLIEDDSFDQDSSDDNHCNDKNLRKDRQIWNNGVQNVDLKDVQTSTPLSNQGAPALTTPNYYQITNSADHDDSMERVHSPTHVVSNRKLPNSECLEVHIDDRKKLLSNNNDEQLPIQSNFTPYYIQNEKNDNYQPDSEKSQCFNNVDNEFCKNMFVRNGIQPVSNNVNSDPMQVNNNYPEISSNQQIQYFEPQANARYTENQTEYLSAGKETVVKRIIRLSRPLWKGRKGNQQAGNNNVTQLQILNKAKSRQIDMLNEQLENMQEELHKEIRILKHELSLKDGNNMNEKNSVDSNLSDVKQLLSECQNKNAELGARIQVQKAQLDAIKESNKSVKQNKIVEMTKNTLQLELKEFYTPESISKEKRHNEALKNLHDKHSKEWFSLNEKIDMLKQDGIMKAEELKIANNKYQELSNAFDKMSVEKSETINRLTRSLEISQKQCQDILESENIQEVAHLKLELKQALSSKENSDELLKTCQQELNIFKEELEIYERASAIIGESTISTVDNETAFQMGKQQKTSLNRTEESEFNLVSSLRNELRHCLDINKNQRRKMISLQEKLASATNDLSECQKSLKQCRAEIEKSEKEIKYLKQKANCSDPNNHISEEKNEKLVLELNNSIEKYKIDLEKLNCELVTANSKEAESKELINKLKNQMSEMIKIHDEDKQIAIDRCRESCLRLHDENLHIITQEISQKCKDDVNKVHDDYENVLNNLNNKISDHVKEIVDLKKLYIQVCEEKKELLKTKNLLKSGSNIFDDFSNVNEDKLKKKFFQVEKEKQELKDHLSKENKKLEKKISFLQEELKNVNNQKNNFEAEYHILKSKPSNRVSVNFDSEIHQKVMEKTAAIEKELNQMISQKNIVENELATLKSKWKNELEMVKYKYNQDLNAAVHRLEDEKCLGQSKMLDEVKKEADDKYNSLLHEQRNILSKYKIAEDEKNEMAKKISAFDNAISQIHDSFQVKLKDAIQKKDEIIQDLSSELSRPLKTTSNDLHKENEELKRIIDELKLKVKKCQKYAIVKEKNYYGEVVKLRTELNITVDNLRHKFDELKHEHKVEMSTEVHRLKKKHAEILENVKSDHGNQLRKLHQKNSQSYDIEKLKASYLQALNSVKSEVLNFIQDYHSRIDKQMRDNLEKLLLQISIPNRVM
ncbi:Centrosomal protein [Nymphon striatum]|nr:Centrosomal protein [Nymphon striatum]